MQKNWFITWGLLAATAGCAGAGSLGSKWTSQKPQQTQLAAKQTPVAAKQTPVAAKQTPGFTQRILDAIKPGSPKKVSQPKPTIVQSTQEKLDSISLGSESGPTSAAFYLSMAQLSDQGDKPDHARSMYQKALSLEPDNLHALLGLARLEDRKGHMGEALRIYQQANNAHPQNTQVLNDLALCHARVGQLPESLQLLSQATQLQPQKALYRNNIAKVLVELDRVDEAANHLAAVHPPAIAQYNIGFLLHQRGRSEEAVHFLAAATHIDPQLQEAGTLLSQITGATTQLADLGKSAPYNTILPTPLTPPETALGERYPTTGALSAAPPTVQTIPTETAQVPVGNSPVLLPPVR